MGHTTTILTAFILLMLLHSIHACSDGLCQLGDSCSSNSDCEEGLFCSTCFAAGNLLFKCHRNRATNVTSIKNGLPFNHYAWLTTHNSFAIIGAPSQTGVPRFTFENQDDTITHQLNNGVRGLMLQMYDYLGDVWLCSSFGDYCYNFTAFGPAIDTLREVETFLSTHPTEIVTIFIEDHVNATNGLTKVLRAAGLLKYWFPMSKMPRNGEDWPTVTKMAASNERLIVFTSVPSKEIDEGIAYQGNYVIESKYVTEGLQEGICPRRAGSEALGDRTKSLILENFFPDIPFSLESCNYNSNLLLQMLNACYNTSSKKGPNFLAVDFYERNTGGGVFQALDMLNAGYLCGCSDLNTCKLGLPYGACNIPPPAPESPTNDITPTPQNVVPNSNACILHRLLWIYCWVICTCFFFPLFLF